MIKKHKKHLALLLAAVMSVSLLAACGGSDDGATTTADATPAPTPVQEQQVGTTSEVGTEDQFTGEQTDEGWTANGYTFGPDTPRTITMYIITNSASPNPDNKIHQKIKDELGVTLEMTLFSAADQTMQNQLLIAGGDYPDIIAQTDQEAEVIKNEALVNLDDLINSGNYPLLKEHVRTNLGKIRWTGADAPAGLYILPNYNRFYGGNPETKPSNANAFFIQKAVLEELGYPDLSNMTLEKYFGILRDYKAANPTIDGVPTIAFVLRTGDQLWATTNMPAVLQGSPNNGGVVVDTSKSPHEPRMYATDDYARRTWEFLNQMYLEGLVDPESFSQSGDEYNAKLASGAVLGTFHQTWAVGTPENTLNSEGRSNRTWVVTTPTFDSIKPYYAWNPTMNVQQGFGISVSANDPAEILAFIEILMTEYWQKVLFWGVEGEDYLVGDDGLFYRTQEMRDNQADVIWQASNQARAFRDQLPKHQGFWPDGNADSPGNQPSEFYAGLSDYDKSFLDGYGYETWTGFVGEIPAVEPPYYPLWQREWISDDAQLAETQMGDISREAIQNLVMAKEGEFDAIWDKYVSDMEKVDITDWLESHRAWIQKYGWQ